MFHWSLVFHSFFHGCFIDCSLFFHWCSLVFHWFVLYCSLMLHWCHSWTSRFQDQLIFVDFPLGFQCPSMLLSGMFLDVLWFVFMYLHWCSLICQWYCIDVTPEQAVFRTNWVSQFPCWFSMKYASFSTMGLGGIPFLPPSSPSMFCEDIDDLMFDTKTHPNTIVSEGVPFETRLSHG